MEDMSYKQVVGARYVPKFYQNSQDPTSSEWESGVAYEPLTNVTYQMNGYCSKKPVPVGIGSPATNPTYWAKTFDYNAAYAGLQDEIDSLRNITGDGEIDFSNNLTNAVNILNSDLIIVPANNPASQSSGDCVIYTSKNKVLMIDSGYPSNYENIKAELNKANIEKIDYFILSHYHIDHFGGVESLINDNFIRNSTICYLPRTTNACGTEYTDNENTVRTLLSGCTIITPDDDTELTVGNFEVSFMNASQAVYDYYESQSYSNGNTYSMWNIIKNRGVTILTTADSSDYAIEYQASLGKIPKCNILKLAHHGSNANPSEPTLLLESEPKNVFMTNSPKRENLINDNYLGEDYGLLWACIMNLGVYCNATGTLYICVNKDEYDIIPSGRKFYGKAFDATQGSWCFDIYVDSTYDGISNGSQYKPFKTLTHALAFAQNLKELSTIRINVIGAYSEPTEDLNIMCKRLIIKATQNSGNNQVEINSIKVLSGDVHVDYFNLNGNSKPALMANGQSQLYANNCNVIGVATSATIKNGAGVRTTNNGFVLLNNCDISNRSCAVLIDNGGVFIGNTISGTGNTNVVAGNHGLKGYISGTVSGTNMIVSDGTTDEIISELCIGDNYKFKDISPYCYFVAGSGTHNVDLSADIFKAKIFKIISRSGETWYCTSNGSGVFSGVEKLEDPLFPNLDTTFSVTINNKVLTIVTGVGCRVEVL